MLALICCFGTGRRWQSFHDLCSRTLLVRVGAGGGGSHLTLTIASILIILIIFMIYTSKDGIPPTIALIPVIPVVLMTFTF